MGWIRTPRRPRRWPGRVAVMAAMSALALWSTASRTGRAAVVPASHAIAPPARSSLQLQTLNVFGLPWPLSPDVAPRCRRIAGEIANSAVDVVVLQEAWGAEAATPFALPFHHRAFGSGSPGLVGSNGLLTLSRHPIRGAEARTFSASQSFDAVVHKGVLITTIVLPDGDLEVWNLHMQSGVGRTATRLLQIRELLDWLADSRAARAAVAGDFNCGPGEPDFAVLLEGMRALGFHHASCGRPTYDATENALAVPEAPKEIDHVFVRGLGEPLAARRVFDQRIDGMLPSDHYGVEVTLGPRR